LPTTESPQYIKRTPTELIAPKTTHSQNSRTTNIKNYTFPHHHLNLRSPELQQNDFIQSRAMNEKNIQQQYYSEELHPSILLPNNARTFFPFDRLD
jgi:hypothetical protein